MLYQPEWETVWLDSWNKAKEAVDALCNVSTVAVDTETSGWQYGSNRLCLAQFSSKDLRKNFLFDCLAFEEVSSLFKPLIENTSVKKVAHNVSFEYKIFESLGLKLQNYACTLELAKKLRPHLASFKLSYLCERFLGFTLDKSWQTSDWMQRPLLEEQIRYAASDSEVTAKIYDLLIEIKSRLDQVSDKDLDELMKLYAEVTRKREQLLEPIFDSLCDYDYLLEVTKEKIREKLPEYQNEYENEYCWAKLQEVRKTEVSIDALRELFPEIADLVIEPYVKRDKLKAVFKEYNIPISDMDKIIVDVGKTYRLQLEVKC